MATALLAFPTPAAPQEQRIADGKPTTRLSQAVAVRYWLAHPDQAPEALRARFQQLQPAIASAGASRQQTLPGVGAPARSPAVQVANRFNRDTLGLPQNEESITGCQANPNIILGGTNDYRGLLDPERNFTGWHLSTDGGNSVANEGLLPPVTVAGITRPSGGDPVVVADDQCNLFAGSLNYDPSNPFTQSNGVGVYKTTSAALASCPGGSSPSCWPTRRAVAEAQPPHFLDKEWIDVGVSGPDGTVVWIVYTDFIMEPTAPLGFTSASIKAVRCDADLITCTAPILISDQDQDVQYGDVTIGPDGRTYITWTEIRGELERTPQTFIHKLRIAPAGSTTFGPTRIIATEALAIPFGGFLHANDFRIATYPKNEVVLVNGRPRIFVVWDACSARIGAICEEPQIKLTFSDNDGASWSPQAVLSEGGDNYFPTIASSGGLAITSDADDASPTDSGTARRARRGRLAIAWYTNRFDSTFHSRQDVELVTVNPSTLQVTKRQRLSPLSNETQADPVLGGLFIGDYFEVFALDRTAYVHFNANYQQLPLLGQGVPVPQQDNYLVKAGL